MRKYWILLCTIFILFLSFPLSSHAASKEIYYTVKGSSKISPGIYKAIPNGKPVPVLKEKVYKMKQTTKPPLNFIDTKEVYINERIAQAADYKTDVELNNEPIQYIQVVGENIYFTKLLARAFLTEGYCRGAPSDILEIYKRSSNGKITKVISDKVSSLTANPFKVIGSYIYYAKIENEAMGNFTIIKSTLDGKKKQVLYKGVTDFWIAQNQIYFIKNGELYWMGLDGKGVKRVSAIQSALYGDGGCAPGNYFILDEGFHWIEDSGDTTIDYYYFNFASKKVTKLPSPTTYDDVQSIDLKKNRFVAEKFSGSYAIVGLYDLKGKLIKKLLTYDYLKSETYIYSVSAKDGQLLYIQGTSLKKITF
jgi:hypothetical protein